MLVERSLTPLLPLPVFHGAATASRDALEGSTVRVG